jgi:hypothetical protein
MVDVSSALTTTMIGMLGVVFGAILSNYVNSRIASKNSRREIIFRKKMDYFESIVQCIEKNTKLYLQSIREFEKNQNAKVAHKIVKKLKSNRGKFDAKTSPIYLDTRLFSKDIKNFVNLEKTIFLAFENLSKSNSDKEYIIKSLKTNMNSLTQLGNKIISKMRLDIIKK